MRAILIRASAAAAVLVVATWANNSSAENPYEESEGEGEEIEIGLPPPLPQASTPVTSAARATTSPSAAPVTPLYVPIYVQPVYVAPSAAPRLATSSVSTESQALAMPQDKLREETRPNASVIASGLIIFGVPYAASVASFGTSKHQGDENLWVPVAGPWLDLANRGTLPRLRVEREDEFANRGLLVADGVFQALGALAIVVGFLSPEVRTTQVVDETAKSQLRMTPMKLGRSGYGIGAVGKF
jgi:hypothetical protein